MNLTLCAAGTLARPVTPALGRRGSLHSDGLLTTYLITHVLLSVKLRQGSRDCALPVTEPLSRSKYK